MFNSTPSAEIYTLSLHDALPIFAADEGEDARKLPLCEIPQIAAADAIACRDLDRKSTRLNSSHPSISYAVFCLKKKTTRLPAHQSVLQSVVNASTWNASRLPSLV